MLPTVSSIIMTARARPYGSVVTSNMSTSSPHPYEGNWLTIPRYNQYIVLKVYVNNSKVHRELPICQYLDQIESKHIGRQCIRLILDSFKVAGPHGQHQCLVHRPLGLSLYYLRCEHPIRSFPRTFWESPFDNFWPRWIFSTGKHSLYLLVTMVPNQLIKSSWLTEYKIYNPVTFWWVSMTKSFSVSSNTMNWKNHLPERRLMIESFTPLGRVRCHSDLQFYAILVKHDSVT